MTSSSGCYLQKKLTSEPFKVLKKTSESGSVLILLPKRKKIFKLSTANVNNDNSLELERNMYDKIGTDISIYSPHFLSASKIGSCNDKFILSLKTSKVKSEIELYERWVMLRSDALLGEMDAHPTALWKKFLQSIPSTIQNDAKKLRLYLASEKTPAKFRNAFNQVYYVETNQIQGVPMEDFLGTPDFKASPNDILQKIFIQIAQALSTLALFKVMHNDLHLGNIFIEKFKKPESIEYFYPKHGEIESQYFVTIFDWDRSFDSQTRVRNTLLQGNDYDFCQRIGTCNKYTPKYDWYTVLTRTLYVLGDEGCIETKSQKELERLLGNLYDEGPPNKKNQTNIGHDAFLGHPCICEKTERKKGKQGQGECVKCKAKSLARLTTPRTFFNKHVLTIKPKRRIK